MASVKKKWAYGLFLALLFALMLVMNTLTPWTADDYHYAFSFATGERLTSVQDIFPSLEAHEHIMNGRSTPHLLVQLFTLLPWWVFDVCNSAIFVLMMMGIVRLVCGPRQYDLLMLVLMTAGVFMLVPGFGPSFLWMAGACNYLWCDVLLVWLLVPFVDALLGRGVKTSVPVQLLMLPAALFFGNMSQNVSAAGVMIMGLIILWMLVKRMPVRWWMFATAAAALAGWYICMRAPADMGRITYGTLSIGRILGNFQVAAEFMVEHGMVPSCALIVLGVLAWYDGASRHGIYLLVVLFLAAMAANYAMLVSVYYPDRAFTGSVLLLICGCGFALRWLKNAKWKTMLSLCLAFGMVVTMLQILPDMYNCYAMYMDREAQVQEAVANGETHMTTFVIKSRSRFDGFYQLHELTDNPDSVYNQGYARLHGLESIVIDRVE